MNIAQIQMSRRQVLAGMAVATVITTIATSQNGAAKPAAAQPELLQHTLPSYASIVGVL